MKHIQQTRESGTMATSKTPHSEETWGIHSGFKMQPFFSRNKNQHSPLLQSIAHACFGSSHFRPLFPVRDINGFRPWVRAETPYFLPSSTMATLFVQSTIERSKKGSYLLPVLKMVAGSICLPKDDPSKPQGEDAHFVSLDVQTLGVADGVGGWCKRGIDSGEFAREIMMNAKIAAQSEPKGNVNPKKVLQEAFSNTSALGGSTACIVTLSGNVLRAANIGDSGFMIVRSGKVVYHSPAQQSYFNCPYQLGRPVGDNISVTQELEVAVEAGDIVIAGTDGLFDNMHDFEIEETVKSKTDRGTQPQELACYIANLALYNSFDRFADTPFARASRKAGKYHKGGKVDDITVIIAFIQASR